VMRSREVMLVAVIACAALAAGQAPKTLQDGPIVRLDTGRIRGESIRADGKNVVAFLGVPFAAPPLGPLRWRPPQPVRSWTGVRDARRFAPACPQAQSLSYGARFDDQSEDCLYLNIWAGAADSRTTRPVMVWIHGGGNIIGGAGTVIYDGRHFAAAGVVLVSVQYRLGPLGYLAHPALTAEARERDGRAASGNYGLLDQIAALEWVRANIASFGGDRNRVTVFGESAGAADITHLLASPLSRGLFHRALAESGYFGESIPRLSESVGAVRSAHDTGLDVARRLGVERQDPAALRSLRALPVQKVQSIPMTIGRLGAGTGGAVRFGPIVDGYVLPRDPGDVWAEGRMQKVPFIAGSNLDDGSVFTRGLPIKSLPAYRLTMSLLFGAEVPRALEEFPANRAEDVPGAVRRVATIVAFRAPARRLVRAVEASGGQAWLYLFSRRPLGALAPGVGVVHGLEVPYVFATLADAGVVGALIGNTDRALSAEMLRRWVAFAETGSPNGRGEDLAGPATPSWPAYDRMDDQHLEFGEGVKVGRHLDRNACDLADEAAWRRRKGT
jgi:para-nitrobenzyl esterase